MIDLCGIVVLVSHQSAGLSVGVFVGDYGKAEG